MENIKLIIWDLDETFWKGTLSDNSSEGVQVVTENIDLVKELTNRGIINTICSKNNYQEAVNILSSSEFQNINDYFVFKSIDWTPKGERIKNLISDMNLRPVNCLFIDDNINNLREAQYILPKLNVCLYSNLETMLENQKNCFIGKDDKNHSRLNQYKILEKKVNDRHLLSSNDNFLRQSEIRVFMIEDNLDLKRIHEMIHRNNQLNFTKNRISMADVERIFTDPTIKSGVVQVIDKYGDNGIVGCYALKDNELIQFVFSCRILGMGVEKYVYYKLNWPEIKIQGEVASTLVKGEIIDYINVNNNVSHSDHNIVISNEKFIAYGECPLRPIWSFLQPKLQECKFNEITPRPSVLNLGRMFYLDDNQITEILKHNPMFHVEWTYDSEIKNKKFKYLLLSLYDENLNYKYFNPDTNSIFYSPKLDENCDYCKKLISTPVSLQDIKSELTNLILNVPHDSTIFILTLSEIVFKSNGKDSNYKYSVESNHLLEELAAKYTNIKLIDIRKYAKYETDFFEPVRKHYNREIGFYLASDIITNVHKDNSLLLDCSSNSSLPLKYLEGVISMQDKLGIKLDYIFYICNFKLYFELKNYNELRKQGYDFLLKLFTDRYEILSTDSYSIDTDVLLNGFFSVEVSLLKDKDVISKGCTSKIEFNINNFSLFLDPNFKNYNNATFIAQKFIEKNVNASKILQRQINQLFYVNNTTYSLSYYLENIVRSKSVNIYFESLDIAKIILMHFEKSSIKINNIFSTKADFIYDEINNTRYTIKNINAECNLNANDCILLCGLSDVNSYEIFSMKKKYNCKFLWLDYVLSYLVTKNITSKFVECNPSPSYIAVKIPNFHRLMKLTSNERVLINTNFNEVVKFVSEKNFNKLPQTLSHIDHEELFETLLSSEEIYDFKNCRYRDTSNTYINVINGLRKTTGQPSEYVGTIYLIGNSKVFGIGVRDEYTIASELQRIINLPYRVVNYSNYYKEMYFKKGIDSLLNTKLKHNDVVVFLLHSEQTDFTNQCGQICWNGIDERIITIDACDLINTPFRPDYFSLKETYTHEFNIALATRIKQAILNNVIN